MIAAWVNVIAARGAIPLTIAMSSWGSNEFPGEIGNIWPSVRIVFERSRP